MRAPFVSALSLLLSRFCLPAHSHFSRRSLPSTIHCMRLALRLRLPAMAVALTGLFSVAFVSAPAQQPVTAATGTIHGRVINPSGSPQKDGTISLSVDGGVTLSYNFPVSPTGNYSGQAPPGEYTIVYRAPDTPEGKIVDYISGVVVAAGQDTAQDIDMTREEVVDRK